MCGATLRAEPQSDPSPVKESALKASVVAEDPAPGAAPSSTGEPVAHDNIRGAAYYNNSAVDDGDVVVEVAG